MNAKNIMFDERRAESEIKRPNQIKNIILNVEIISNGFRILINGFRILI